MVDGKEILCSDEEERVIRMHWALNDKYPQYVGHLMFDGVNEPIHDIVECKKHHSRLLNQAYEQEMKSVNDLIEIAQEEGKDPTPLLAQRKSLRALASQDLSQIKTVEELIDSVPALFKKYWVV